MRAVCCITRVFLQMYIGSNKANSACFVIQITISFASWQWRMQMLYNYASNRHVNDRNMVSNGLVASRVNVATTSWILQYVWLWWILYILFIPMATHSYSWRSVSVCIFIFTLSHCSDVRNIMLYWAALQQPRNSRGYYPNRNSLVAYVT